MLHFQNIGSGTYGGPDGPKIPHVVSDGVSDAQRFGLGPFSEAIGADWLAFLEARGSVSLCTGGQKT